MVRALLESDHRVAMLTGDALLTSLHVARQVGICAPEPLATATATGTGGGGERGQLTLVGAAPGAVCPLPPAPPLAGAATAPAGPVTGPYWSLRLPSGAHQALPLVTAYAAVAALDGQYDLLTTEADFLLAAEVRGRPLGGHLWGGAVSTHRSFPPVPLSLSLSSHLPSSLSCPCPCPCPCPSQH